MLDPKIIGRRLKYFRKRADISQLDLEIALDMSQGSVSRIESGKVNPTKETVLSIAWKLNMNDREIDYVIGSLFFPANESEIAKAIEEVKGMLDRPGVFAYLIDDRYRLLYLSRGFEILFRRLLPDFENKYARIKNKNMVILFCDEDIQIEKYMAKDKFIEMMKLQLGRLRSNMDFMIDDESYIEVENIIKKNKLINQIWNEIDYKNMNFNTLESRQVVFKLMGIKIGLNFSREPVWKYPRFETIKYIPSNKFLQIYNKILSRV